MICSSIARMRSSSSHESLGVAVREHLDLVELVHAEDAARVLAVRAGLAPEARRVAGVAGRQLVGREHLAAVQRRERDLARADEEQLAVVDVVHLRAVGREEARPPPSCARARASGVITGTNPCVDDRLHRVVDERELEQRGLAHDVREAAAARFRAARACRRTRSRRRTRRGRAAARRSASPTTSSSSPSSSPPSGTDASAGFGTCSASVAERAVDRLQLGFLRAAALPSARPRPRSSPAARRARPCRSPSTPRSGGRAAPSTSWMSARRASSSASTSSISPARTRLRSMPRRYSGSSRSRLTSITRARPSRICARSCSTHVAACFHARPARAAPLDAGFHRTADRIRAEELHLGLLRREVAQPVGDQLVGDVALDVDEEAVVAEAALGRARLELRQVDRARRELLEDARAANPGRSSRWKQTIVVLS